MMTPRESFEEIARLLTVAVDQLSELPDSPATIDLLSTLVGAHTHAPLQAGTLLKRERAGDLFAMPCPTESLN
jgi:hypothetical protein